MLDIYIFDRDKNTCGTIKGFCEAYLIERNYDSEIRYCGSDEGEAEALFEAVPYSSLFMLEAYNRLDIMASKIRKVSMASYIVILLKNYSDIVEFMSPAVRPSGFVIKPPDDRNIGQLLDEITNDYRYAESQKSKKQFRFKTKSRDYAIDFDNIIFFEARDKKIHIRTTSQEFAYYGSFGEIEKAMDDDFVRIHRSFMINSRHVTEVNRRDGSIAMDDGSVVFFSRTYKNAVEALTNKG